MVAEDPSSPGSNPLSFGDANYGLRAGVVVIVGGAMGLQRGEVTGVATEVQDSISSLNDAGNSTSDVFATIDEARNQTAEARELSEDTLSTVDGGLAVLDEYFDTGLAMDALSL